MKSFSMCGFVGLHTPHDPSLMDPVLLGQMTDMLAHRGPDDGACYRQPGIGLGVRRLAIIDPVGGAQPIFNEDRSIVLVCNGEIYNHRTLRADLQRRGHRFRAGVDIEVLVHLYEDHGIGFLDRLEGQFAFALHDSRRRLLLLARDPAGIAPIFYAWRQKTLLFASEIKALLAHPLVERRIDLTGLDQVVTLPGPVSPRTLFADVHSLEPGHYLLLHDGRLVDRVYWDLDYPLAADFDPEGRANFDELENRLRDAVETRLLGDVPVGLYLSGGLDSSLVAAMASDIDRTTGYGGRRHAFSIGFETPEIDESVQQRLVADITGVAHHQRTFTTEDIETRLREAVWHAETPLKESYNTCSLALSALVRGSGLKVVLTGEGADELFGGYVGYRLDSDRSAGDDFMLDQALENELRDRLWGDSSFFYEKDYTAFEEVKGALYSPALSSRLRDFACTREPLVDATRLRGRHRLHQRSYVDFKLRLADHLLADHGDRVGYANSVEARYPFLDRAVIEWVRNAPPECLVHDGWEKYPLRIVAGRYLPDTIAKRSKFGFVAPSSAALLQQCAACAEDYLSPARTKASGYFNPDAVERLKAQYREPGFSVTTTFDTDLLMIVLTFEIFRDWFLIPSL
jgi:asparagine synthase (glutamine-hydrolysing)